MYQIENRVLEKALQYNGTVVLKYRITYPVILYESISAKKFNDFYLNQALELKQKSETEYYQEAVKLYQYNTEQGYPVMVYEIDKTYEITFHTKDMISLFSDEYIFSGGAHGNTVRTSETWNMISAKQMELYEFFGNHPYFMLEILKNIFKQIEENETIYFEDYCKLVIATFDPKNFYVTPKNIMIYFQQYDIAPYSSGIPVFKAILL